MPSIVHPANAQAPTAPRLFMSPSNVTTLVPLYSLITFNVSVSNIPAQTPIGVWDIVVAVADPTILKPVSINQIETFGGTISVFSDCINSSGLNCAGGDTFGVAHFAATTFSGPYPPTPNDTLFSVTFNSTATTGYTSISILQDQAATTAPLLSDNANNEINVGVPGGAVYGNAALAPVAAFTWSPYSPFQYDELTVNASLSHAFGGATITNYYWPSKTTTQNVTTLVFKTPGNQSVSLTVRDSKGHLSLPVTHFIFVRVKSTIDLNLNGLSLSEYNYIHPGDKLLVTATVFNNGTTTVNAFNVTLRLDNQVIAVLQNTGNVTLNQYANLKYTWDTTNIRPSSYTLSATASILIGDNNTSDKYLSVDIRFIEFQGSTLLGVGLVPFGGLLTIIILGGGITAYSLAQRSARKRRAQQEAL